MSIVSSKFDTCLNFAAVAFYALLGHFAARLHRACIKTNTTIFLPATIGDFMDGFITRSSYFKLHERAVIGYKTHLCTHMT